MYICLSECIPKPLYFYNHVLRFDRVRAKDNIERMLVETEYTYICKLAIRLRESFKMPAANK